MRQAQGAYPPNEVLKLHLGFEVIPCRTILLPRAAKPFSRTFVFATQRRRIMLAQPPQLLATAEHHVRIALCQDRKHEGPAPVITPQAGTCISTANRYKV